MNPLDLLNPDNYDWSDEDWIVFYGDAITDFVTESHSVKQVIADERRFAYKWVEDLIKKLVDGRTDYFYEAPIIVDKLFDKIKKLEGEK